MNRKHTIEYYLSIIEKLKKANQNIKISSDFIIGYPEETEKDFNDTIDLIKKIGFINSYSFIFSARPGTPAAEKKLNNLEKNKMRLKKLKNILGKYQLQNNQMYLSYSCEVLVENKLNNQEKYFGRDKFMIPVKFESNNCRPGQIVDVHISSFDENSLFGSHKIDKVEAA
jgi:tRNA-2-methylthio-N6-dimethylallyladenosine synthase